MADSNITKKALATAMKQLMAEKSFAKISVSDICNLCHMNRKSFYYHFKDKYDLVIWIFQTEFIEQVNISRGKDQSWDVLNDLLVYFYTERAFYRQALLIKGQNSFQQYFRELISQFVVDLSENLFKDEADHEFYVLFFTEGIIATLIHWLSEANPAEPGEYLNMIKGVTRSEAKRLLDELQ